MRTFLLLLLITTLFSCRKAIQPSPTEEKKAVSLQFDASAYDSNAKLYVQIFDTDSKHVYYTGTTDMNVYSGSTEIIQGSSVTFSVTCTANTNISSQITSNNQAVSTGNFNALQSPGLSPQVVLYYKVP